MSANKIFLDPCYRHEEALAAAAFSPGHVLMYNSAGKVLKHATAGGKPGVLMVAKEDSLQGLTIDDAYSSDNQAFFGIPHPGAILRPRVAAGAVAIAVGDRLISKGDGTVQKRLLENGKMFEATASSSALNSHTTITPFDVSYTIPANSLRVGDVLRIRAVVNFPNASNSTETVLITLKIGSVTIIATAALDNAAADIAYIDATVHVRAIGATGSILAIGTQQIGAQGSVAAEPFYLAATTLDTTAANAVTVNQTCSGSHANTGGVLVELVVENNRDDIDLFVAKEAVDNSAGVAETFVKAAAAA